MLKNNQKLHQKIGKNEVNLNIGIVVVLIVMFHGLHHLLEKLWFIFSGKST